MAVCGRVASGKSSSLCSQSGSESGGTSLNQAQLHFRRLLLGLLGELRRVGGSQSLPAGALLKNISHWLS